jgi:glycine dehydrogenase subunit 1
MALMGASGLRKVAATCHANVQRLLDALTALPGVSRTFAAPVFHEAAVTLDRPVAPVLAQLSANGILGGYDLSEAFPELGHTLLVCATENRTDADIRAYADALADILGEAV